MTISAIGIIAAQGNLPVDIVKELGASKIDYRVVNIDKSSELDGRYIPFTKVGKILEYFKKEGVKDLLFVGRLRRPNFYRLMPDVKGMKLLAKIAGNYSDNNIFSTISDFMMREGFNLVSVKQVAPNLICPKGLLTKRKISTKESLAIEAAKLKLKQISSLDIGQSMVIAGDLVVAVEAAEGTEEMIARAAILLKGNVGTLLKLRKPIQSDVIDLPVIGVDTIDQCYRAGIEIIGIEAGESIIIERERVLALASKRKIAIIGL